MSDGPPPTPSKRQRAKALEDLGIPQDAQFESSLPCIRCFGSALTVASTLIATNPETPIDVPTFGCKFPFINSKKCTNCDKNICIRVPAMMNGNYMDIFSIFKAIDKMLKDGTARFQDAHKLGIAKTTVPDSKESNFHQVQLDYPAQTRSTL
ncbi:uncharacterized protein FTJAE_2871 [Fusarium tjaetaba]|uniref:Uncharacterized protein n=1 Tax=Fusarium tjaetaba TaxID=1567544 RepID=A0A8H5S4T5_9HYPO|nr:uncharacterized protein FTJAE_2871 [Fusarium tjaetaba]KAF5644182.1 hypothetical protein FTJAE_2871 [Fusarium tjaetaba]